MKTEEIINVIKEDALYNPEVAEAAIAALEKQIPAKPVFNAELNKLWVGTHLCPKCYAYVNIWSNIYCDRCGQRLEWKKDEEN